MRKIGIAILTAAVASVTFVQAYVIDPQGLRWFGARATFTSYFDTADAQRAVAEAVRSWQSPLEDAVELQAVAGSGSAAIGNSTSELGWESLPPEVVSLTRIVSRSGRIIEADVSVARDGASRGPWSLDAIVSHPTGKIRRQDLTQLLKGIDAGHILEPSLPPTRRAAVHITEGASARMKYTSWLMKISVPWN